MARGWDWCPRAGNKKGDRGIRTGGWGLRTSGQGIRMGTGVSSGAPLNTECRDSNVRGWQGRGPCGLSLLTGAGRGHWRGSAGPPPPTRTEPSACQRWRRTVAHGGSAVGAAIPAAESQAWGSVLPYKPRGGGMSPKQETQGRQGGRGSETRWLSRKVATAVVCVGPPAPSCLGRPTTDSATGTRARPV